MTMTFPDVTVLLARQRSGTNALRSVLDTHPEICCFDEVFKFEDRRSPDPTIRASNYFTFLEAYCAGDITRAFPDRHEQIFADYVTYLRGLTPKRHIVVDVKYNSTHHIAGVWRSIGAPTLFELIKAQGLGVIQLTRHNHLRCLVSTLKGRTTGRYYVRSGAAPPDLQVTVPPVEALATMEHWAYEDNLVAGAFLDWPRFLRVEYSDLFPDASGAMAPAALQQLATWFGVRDTFTNQATLTKQSSLPLDQTIANFAQLRVTLHGTPFEWCLADEPAYRVAAPACAAPS